MPITNRGKYLILYDGASRLSLLTNTIKAMLLSNQFVPNRDHQFVSDISYYEVSGAGYAAGFGGSGRQAIAGRSVAVDTAADIAYFDFNDVVWPGLLCGTVGYVALIREATSDADSDVICLIELATAQETNGAEWTYQVASPGAFTW